VLPDLHMMLVTHGCSVPGISTKCFDLDGYGTRARYKNAASATSSLSTAGGPKGKNTWKLKSYVYRTWNSQGITEDNRLTTSFDEVTPFMLIFTW